MRLFARHDTLIAIIVTAVLTGVYYFGVVCPGRSTAQEVREELARYHAKMGAIPLILAEQSRLQSLVDQQRQGLAQVNFFLPEDSHVSHVLHDVTSLAHDSGLMVNRLELLSNVQFASYSAHPFHLRCRGEFKQIAAFLAGLETRPQLVTFGSVELTRDSEANTNEIAGLIHARIYFSVYSRHAKSTELAENTISQRALASDN